MPNRHKMPGLLVRWWRWWTNPTPCPGEVWIVPGLGMVEIQAADSSYEVNFRASDGRAFVWWASRFIERCVPAASVAVKLDEVPHADR
jgi:hypothetical protein